MVRARRRNDFIPNDGRICGLSSIGVLGAPFSRDVDEHLLCVPCEQRRQVGVQVEAHNRKLFFFPAIVVRATTDSIQCQLASLLLSFRGLSRLKGHSHLQASRPHGRTRRPRMQHVGSSNQACNDCHDGGEEAKDILEANKR